MMKVAIDEVVEMVSMRHCLMPATWTMLMVGGVRAMVLRRAGVGIGGIHGNHMLVDVVAMHVLEMSVIEIVDMPLVADSHMAARCVVLVRMAGKCIGARARHFSISLLQPIAAGPDAAVYATRASLHLWYEIEKSRSAFAR
jgi:hypothetical protein